MTGQPILVVSHEVVGRRQAGPGIRALNLARVLARHMDVVLAVPAGAEPGGPGETPFEVWPYRRGDWQSLGPAAHRAGAIVAAGDSLAEFPALERLAVPFVVDGYDPHTLETLALWAGEPAAVQAARHQDRRAIVKRQCRAADFLMCASDRQRDWWLGVLEEEGRINPGTYRDDPSLRRLVDVVPFGVPPEPPAAARPVVRGVWPGIGVEDWIVLWGGGLWEWLDPLTALRAVRRLADDGIPMRLVFPGTHHPNPAMPDMPMRSRAVALARELGLAGEYAFFGDWVPYEDWPSVLAEADIGLSLHPDTVETRLSYRTRVLDYVWGGLPMVVTRGDEASDLVARYGLGRAVDFGDDAAVAVALAELEAMGRPRASEAFRAQFDAARRDLSWERAAAPLVAFCREPRRAADRPAAQWPSVAPRVEQKAAVPVPADPPSISVIVLAWNGEAYIEECLAAVLAQDYPAVEVIVVDNGSTDGTAGLVAQRFGQVRLMCNPRNLGFAAGNNVGLRAAGGDVLVLLNQDTVVHPGWLAALARAFDEPTAGIAGCKLLYPDGTVQHAGGLTFGPRGETDHVGRGAPDDERVSRPNDAEFVTGAALAIRRATMEQIGLLDEGFSPAYFEDIDWCYRARAGGWRVVYAPDAVVTHFESTATDAGSHEAKFALHQGRLRFLLKHRPADWLLDEFGPAEEAWVASMDRIEELMAARRAALGAILALPEIVAFRQSPPEEAAALAGMLAGLRAAAVRGLAQRHVPAPAPTPPAPVFAGHTAPGDEPAPARPPAAREALARPEDIRERARLLDGLEAAQSIHERPFASGVPVVGRLIAGFRSLWNSISTRWYVRPLVQQQNAFNLEVVGYLRVLQQQLDHQLGHVERIETSLSDLDDALHRLDWALGRLGRAVGRLGEGLEWHGEMIGWASRRADELEARSGEQARVLQGQLRDVAENVREITALAEQVAALRAELQRPPAGRDPRKGERG